MNASDLYKFSFKTVETVYTKDTDIRYPPAGLLSSIKIYEQNNDGSPIV